MMNPVKKTRKPRKVVDETTEGRCAFRKGILRGQVWQDSWAKSSSTTRFINHSLWAEDRGRVLGYDNSHGHHRRHYAGAEVKFSFVSDEKLVERFLNEVRKLREKREPI